MNIVELPPSATVRTATVLQQALKSALEAHDRIELDLTPVTDIDLSFVQLVEAARRFAHGLGKAVRLNAPAPAPVTALLERAGFLTDPTPDDLDFWFHGVRPQ